MFCFPYQHIQSSEQFLKRFSIENFENFEKLEIKQKGRETEREKVRLREEDVKKIKNVNKE